MRRGLPRTRRETSSSHAAWARAADVMKYPKSLNILTIFILLREWSVAKSTLQSTGRELAARPHYPVSVAAATAAWMMSTRVSMPMGLIR